MAIIDPKTRMNPAAASFHEAASAHLERIGDERFQIDITPNGMPYLMHYEVALEWPQSSDIHGKREAALKILALCNSIEDWHKLKHLYDDAYFAAVQDEAYRGRHD